MPAYIHYSSEMEDTIQTRAGKSKSLIRWKKAKRREKAEKGGKNEFDLQLDFWQKSTSLVEMS